MVTFEQLVQFVNDEGEDYNVTIEAITFVGVDNVLKGIAAQAKAKTSAMLGANALLEQHTNATEAMRDYFGDGGFDRAFDLAWHNQ